MEDRGQLKGASVLKNWPAQQACLLAWTAWTLPTVSGFHLGLASGNDEKGVEAFEGLSPAGCALKCRQADYLTICLSPNICLH